MKLFKKIFNNSTKKTNSDEKTGFESLMQYFDNSGILDALRQSDLTAATYYACMQIRCNALAKIPFRLYRKNGDGAETIDHDLQNCLNSARICSRLHTISCGRLNFSGLSMAMPFGSMIL